MEIDREKIAAAIVRQVSEELISDDGMYDRVKKDIDARVNKLFVDRVNSEITAAIDSAVRGGFDRPFQKCDAYGRPVGEPTTIADELAKRIDKYWSERVGTDGKSTDSSYNTVTRAEWLMAKICAEDFQKEIKQHAISVTGALKDGFRRELHETCNRLLSDLFHVRSLDDQGKNRDDMSRIRPPAGPVGA